MPQPPLTRLRSAWLLTDLPLPLPLPPLFPTVLQLAVPPPAPAVCRHLPPICGRVPEVALWPRAPRPEAAQLGKGSPVPCPLPSHRRRHSARHALTPPRLPLRSLELAANRLRHRSLLRLRSRSYLAPISPPSRQVELRRAQRTLGLSLSLGGARGKRTKFQQQATALLIMRAALGPDALPRPAPAAEAGAGAAAVMPTSVAGDDDTLLEVISLTL